MAGAKLLGLLAGCVGGAADGTASVGGAVALLFRSSFSTFRCNALLSFLSARTSSLRSSRSLFCWLSWDSRAVRRLGQHVSDCQG